LKKLDVILTLDLKMVEVKVTRLEIITGQVSREIYKLIYLIRQFMYIRKGNGKKRGVLKE
jgi:hypothetical protein